MESSSLTLAKASNGLFENHKEDFPADVPESIGADGEHKVTNDGEHKATNDGEYNESHREDESENFSDIDDQEVDGYLHNEEEKNFKKIIWEKLNREYLEEQAVKETVAAKRSFEAKSRTEMKPKRSRQVIKSGPAQSAAEETHQMLGTKRLSSKINYDRLFQLFSEPAEADNLKKTKTAQCDLPSDNRTPFQCNFEDKNDDEMGSGDEFEDEGDIGEMYENAWRPENMDGSYFPEDDGYNYNDDDY
ncbi:uncharacterized protein LOC113863837 [Abrus precatorius]|uniref:Uncharacterized protein LOC113863837 n=1 Tax=Abrus precatorius TaxID=3816 RepID=A0A8B8LAX1_ABRPR|nr:uncharacterized protein LOC113863837 [Abrus precatorius]